MLFARCTRLPDSKSAPLAICAFMILSVSSIRIGIKRSAIDIIIEISCTGTWRRFKHPRLRSKPSVSWFGVVVSVMTEEPITRYIRRRPMKTASRKPSCVTFKNPIWKITRPFVRNRLKLILISNRNTIALSPRTINLNGTREARIAIARNTVATA